jgi:outer membrane receptor protein involved in Fe transport
MKRTAAILLGIFLVLAAGESLASVFGTIKAIVHDPQHRPVQGAQVEVHSRTSAFKATGATNVDGIATLQSIPVGEYDVRIISPGFTAAQQGATVISGGVQELHFALSLAQRQEIVQVSGQPELVNPASAIPQALVSRNDIARTPGADRTNSMAMITDFVPGAAMVHDQLHVRGGHQVTWAIDGVPVPNTNIATNVGPQFDPKDIDTLEVQRGGLSAEYGDRVYSVMNVVTRSGFEFNNQCQVVASFGSFNETNDQLSCGSHTDRFAYFGSISGNRTDLGLETPSPEVVHDLGSGLSGFMSLIFNKTPADQFRMVASVRGDHYQVPNTPQQQADGIRDVENERDVFLTTSWVHSGHNGILLTVAPFVHLNRAHYVGALSDTPISPEDDHRSNYFGGVTTVSIVRGRHNFHAGFQGFAQNEKTFFALRTPAPPTALSQSDDLWGSVVAAFFEEQFRATNWLTFNSGLRLTHYSGPVSENAADPRIGAAIQVPKLKWVLRGFYGRYYQAPPLSTVSGPVIEQAINQGFTIVPLHGERDEQYEVGIGIPVDKWRSDFTFFQTKARNYFDHDVLLNSNIFLPVTLDGAKVRGWEASIQSPKMFGRAELHLAYSHQWVMGFGGVSGGLIDPASIPDEAFFLDHDQRHTLSTGVQVSLPWRAWASTNVNYGSGFLDGEGPEHLPAHTTVDLAVGKSFGENWSVRLSALNLGNRRYLLDNSNTFGGTHWADPRMVSGQVRYTFRF